MKARPTLALPVVLFCFVTFSPSRAEEPASQAAAVLDAPYDKVWDATVASLRDSGYRISKDRRSSGFVEGQLGRTITHMGEGDPFAELKRISWIDESIPDVRVASEYRVILNVDVKSTTPEHTRVQVRGQIVAVDRPRGRRGTPRPIPIPSRGVVEAELLQHIRERLGLTS
jgi:hypothetical protein